MDAKLQRTSEAKSSLSMMSDPGRSFNSDQPFVQCNPMNLSQAARPRESFPDIPPSQSQSLYDPDPEVIFTNQFEPTPTINNTAVAWDPHVILSNLSFLEQKIRQAQDMLRSIINQEGRLSNRSDELARQQQLVTQDLTCIIIQLVSTAGSLLPPTKNTLLTTGQMGGVLGTPTQFSLNGGQQQHEVVSPEVTKPLDYEELIKSLNTCDDEELFKCSSTCLGKSSDSIPVEDHDLKESDDGIDGENLPPGSYEVLQLKKEEILAPHTHFCSICGKGFKRDANLRMHMRGHGDEYKTPAALARPIKDGSAEVAPIRRYSCPFVGCKRNKEHKKFQPLKTILCVKNHYKRSHCDKSYTCSRCNIKKFSVIADLKTHEKHCGRDKWLCSCGTTFSRKDKLFGHVALFQGHTPALPMDDVKASGTSEQVQGSEAMNGIMGSTNYNLVGNSDNIQSLGTKEIDDSRSGCFSPLNFDSCNFGGLDEFPRVAFGFSENPFTIIPSSSCNFQQINGGN
ncbi:zinc finger protein STOP1 homolog [Typha angustifolia]|uniref:zinc finger protein STOP1 homolog n=1 Tax=Typha angustifolia TaxID=59011 RepID=UPI003C2F7FB6